MGIMSTGANSSLSAHYEISQHLRLLALQSDDNDCVPQGFHFCTHIIEPGTKEVERRSSGERGIVLHELRLLAMQ